MKKLALWFLAIAAALFVLGLLASEALYMWVVE